MPGRDHPTFPSAQPCSRDHCTASTPPHPRHQTFKLQTFRLPQLLVPNTCGQCYSPGLPAMVSPFIPRTSSQKTCMRPSYLPGPSCKHATFPACYQTCRTMRRTYPIALAHPSHHSEPQLPRQPPTQPTTPYRFSLPPSCSHVPCPQSRNCLRLLHLPFLAGALPLPTTCTSHPHPHPCPA